MKAGEQRGTSDRFVLKLVKPGQLGADAPKSGQWHYGRASGQARALFRCVRS
jgi:hypothetical protein